MSNLLVVVPYLAVPWALEDMLETFGESNVPVLIVDNSPDSHAYNSSKSGKPPIRYTDMPNVEILAHPENIGSTGAWNIALKRGYDQTLIMSQWVRFAPMEFPRRFPKDVTSGPERQWGLDYVARGIEKYASPYGLSFGDQGYHLICIGKKTVETVGLFDENLYFYGNDDDYVHRMDLANIRGELPDWGNYIESGVYSMTFAAHKRGASNPDMDRMRAAGLYYYEKWCSTPDKHPGDYPTPFNRADKDIKWWPTNWVPGKAKEELV